MHKFPQILSVATLLAFAFAQPAQANVKRLIVGGQNASINDFPSTVALLDENILAETGSAADAHLCGGTLIQSTWVLTAAHCVMKSNGSFRDLTVLTGSDDLDDPDYRPTPIARTIVHEQYSPGFAELGDDIALLELSYAPKAPPVALNETRASTNDLAYITGWGALNYERNKANLVYATELQVANVRILEGEQCAALGGDYSIVNAETQVCAGAPDGATSGCYGDSGGPLFILTPMNTLRLAGVTSWGVECGKGGNNPGVYADVVSYTDWINAVISSSQTAQETREVEPVVDSVEAPKRNSGITPTEVTRTQTQQRLTSGGSSSGVLLSVLLTLLYLRRRA